MSKSVLLSTRAQKEFKKLSREVRKRIKKALLDLAVDARGLDTRKLKGVDGREDLYRLRIGDYRVIYYSERKFIKVIRIQRRSKAYEWLD